MMKSRILIIDDEQRMRRILQLLLEENGFLVETAQNGIEGIAAWKKFRPDIVMTDIKMPQSDGMDVLAYKKTSHPETPLIILTAFGSIEKAVHAIKQGAFDYLTKPFKNTDVIRVIKEALKKSAGAKDSNNGQTIIGSSSAVREMINDIKTIARTETSVLITGDSGTGKELVARAIHRYSNRNTAPLVKVNCSAIPKDLLESELFGHIKGAFTGAVSNRQGSFQKADKGVLFLDEIGDLPMDLQPKLLHAVEDKTITPIGASRPRQVDVKIVSASNRDFQEMIDTGMFRKDLFFRLNTYNIHLPKLKHRHEDIDELVQHFIGIFSEQFDKQVTGINQDALNALKKYDWPGNIRELRNCIERAILKTGAQILSINDFPANFKHILQSDNLEESIGELDLEEREKQLIVKALDKTAGNQVHAAKLLNITRNTLRYRMKKYNI